MIKVAYCRQRIQYRKVPSLRRDGVKTARISLDLKSDYLLDSWAVSAYEKFGLNENADGFERDQLKEAHRSFVGSWVCLDHENWDANLAVGSNVDAVYMPDDYVRVAMAVNRKQSEARRPGLERNIADGVVTDTSMGVFASRSMCTIPTCANIASDEGSFCEHVRYPLRGTTICDRRTGWKPVRCGELNRGLHFFENTIITSDEGADRNAKILSKLASTAVKQRREIDAILSAIRETAIDADEVGLATLARLTRRLHEELQ